MKKRLIFKLWKKYFC